MRSLEDEVFASIVLNLSWLDDSSVGRNSKLIIKVNATTKTLSKNLSL